MVFFAAILNFDDYRNDKWRQTASPIFPLLTAKNFLVGTDKANYSSDVGSLEATCTCLTENIRFLCKYMTSRIDTYFTHTMRGFDGTAGSTNYSGHFNLYWT